MMRCQPVFAVHDKERIIDRIQAYLNRWTSYTPYLDWFRSDLDTARAIPPVEVPDDVITMNTRFTVTDLKSGQATDYTLVYPEDEALDAGKLCVLSPMGMAVLGARVGDVVRWSGARTVRAVKVAQILYQPEAAGDHHL